MRVVVRVLVLLYAASLIALSVGCDPVPDDDDGTSIEDCPEELLFQATVCDEIYCGEPIVRVGTGITAFEPVEEGQEVPIWYGSQGGYHLDITVEMMNMCPIVFLRPYFKVVPRERTMADYRPVTTTWEVATSPIQTTTWPEPTEPYEVFSQNRHVQAVRVEPNVSPRQHFWGIRAFVPCEHWPDDPEHDLDCPEGRGSEGFLESFDAIIGVEAWDHHGIDVGEPTRYGHDFRTVDPYCCGGGVIPWDDDDVR